MSDVLKTEKLSKFSANAFVSKVWQIALNFKKPLPQEYDYLYLLL